VYIQYYRRGRGICITDREVGVCIATVLFTEYGVYIANIIDKDKGVSIAGNVGREREAPL
jgi:hypothetical protein